MNIYFAQNGTADAASMFGDDIYAAGFCHGLELAAGESYNGVGKSHVYGLQQVTQEGTEVSAAYAKMQILFTQNTFLHPLLNPNFKIDSFYLFFIFGLFCRWYQLLCGGNGAPLLLRPVPARDA